MAEQWRALGHEVEFVYGAAGRATADLLVPNVDLTVLPPEYVRYFDAFERVVNRQVIDISKRSFSRLGVRKGDGYSGPVIVKSDLNSGGRPERKAYGKTWRDRKIARWLFRRDAITGFHPRLPVDPARYPVFDSPGDLPRGTLGNPRLHVERFVPERDGDLYCTRSYAFAGTAELAVRTKARVPVVKARGIVDRTEVEVPDELRAVREELGFDYGKFDYTMFDGELQLLDINRTPIFGPAEGVEDRHRGIADRFARGLLEQFGLA
jgi:hypothetical protein